jgi:diketogulonate reductase-like aldo/keto reductase
VNYSVASRRCEERLLPACADNGVAVQINLPFEKARLFTLADEQPVPDFAEEIGAESWAQLFLKFVSRIPR